MKLKRIEEELERLRKCDRDGILPDRGKELIKEYEQVLSINYGRGIVDLSGVGFEQEFCLCDIIQIEENFPDEKRAKLASVLQKMGNKNNPPHTFIEMMGFEPVKGKEDTYVKIKY